MEIYIAWNFDTVWRIWETYVDYILNMRDRGHDCYVISGVRGTLKVIDDVKDVGHNRV